MRSCATKRQRLEIVVHQHGFVHIAGRELRDAHGLNPEFGVVQVKQPGLRQAIRRL
jgi:hypothetical protein